MARTREHPGAFVFDSVPGWNPETMAQVGPFQMPPEMQQILAIHVFDNLGVPLPTEESMRLRLVQRGENAREWVPASEVAADDVDPAADEDVVEPVDINVDDLSLAQLNHLEDLIAQKRVDESIRLSADAPVETDTPEWLAYRERRMEELAANAAPKAESDVATQIGVDAATAPADVDPTDVARDVDRTDDTEVDGP
ncbi:hypothetical protein OG579_17145 [Williamsia herbipolensis]|uniref:DUF2744 domain-containing protein n=1 Tax=Williamsia herbipolensis TaxID=1603258 RepID=A0AAU4K049_9NOCA|nr:hypothetical protein [Williamsia herbipolensis]